MKTMLGIDPGTACGWALLRDGKLIEAGAWDLGARRHEGGGMRFLRLRSLLAEVGRMSIDAVAYEEIRRHMGVDAAHIYGGIIATLSSWCEERGTPYQGVPVGTVKKLATGKGNAEKVYMLAAALEKWPNLRESKVTHDVADACWIAETAAQRLGWWGGAR